MANRPVLAHHRLVLEYHAQVAAVVAQLVRAAHQPNRLVAFHRTCARIGGERADASDVIDNHAGDLTIGGDRHTGSHAVIARMDIGLKRLQTVGDELDRPAQHDAHRRSRHFVSIDMQLHAEGAADILRDNTHIGLRQT